jgi:hypothetical protein
VTSLAMVKMLKRKSEPCVSRGIKPHKYFGVINDYSHRAKGVEFCCLWWVTAPSRFESG